jgi:hypothetical protein
MANFFETLERMNPGSDRSGLPGWFSTHPSPVDRVQVYPPRFPNNPAGVKMDLTHVQQQMQDEVSSPGTAPKVTIDDITGEIAEVHYMTAADGVRILPVDSPLHRLTFCVIVLKNGFTFTGESACVSAANYDKAYGERLAFKKAQDKAWSHLAFRLADRLAAAKVAAG